MSDNRQQPRPDTPRRRRSLSAGFKLLLTLAFLIGVTLLPPRVSSLYMFPAAALTLAWAWSRMPLAHGLRRLLVAELFILGIGALTLLAPSSAPVFFSAFLKSNLCVLALILLTWTTPFHDILAVLKRCRIPPLMITILALMYRYLPVLVAESRRMQRARQSRTFSKRHSLGWATLTSIIGQLFIRAAARAERIYAAMCARGWQ